MTRSSATKTPHVTVIPFPFSSHPLCIHSLVVRLARSSPNTLFTFLNTPTSNASLFNNANNKTHLPPNLKPYDLDANDCPGDSEAIRLFCCSMVRPGTLEAALHGAAAVAGGAEVTGLLIDASLSVFLHEAGELRRAGLPWIAVWTATSLLLSAFVHMDLIRERCAEAAANGDDVSELALDFVPGLAAMRASDLQPRELFLGKVAEGRFLHGISRMGQALPGAKAVVLNSLRELCPDGFNMDMESKFQSVLNVGSYTISVPQLESDPTGCLAWLEGQKARSVAYISFGTSVEVSEEEIKATAEALQETEISFLWSLRDVQKRHLPNGFVERTQHHGKVVTWMNQVQVLGHGSVGVHVSHCGYNSMNESIVNGVPIIGRPFWGDQYECKDG